MYKHKLTRLIVALVVPLILFSMKCKNGSQSEQVKYEEKVRVKMVKVEQKEFSLPIHTSGKLSSKTETKLSFKIGGIIESILVDEGQRVQKGQLLARLNLSEINAQVNQARSGFEKAKRDLERIKKLYADAAATLEQVQDATTGLEIANSNLNVAEFNLRHAMIYAPSDGKILKRFVEVNELAAAGIPIFIFGTTSRDWIVRVGVSDRDVVRLRLTDPAFVLFDAYPKTTFQAHITEIAEAADIMSGTFEVELKVNEGTYKLVSGFVAKVDIIPFNKQQTFVIPIEALMEGDGVSGFVYTLDVSKERVKKIPVKISSIFEKNIMVESGLEKVSEVITDGAPYLRDGSVVEVVGNH